LLEWLHPILTVGQVRAEAVSQTFKLSDKCRRGPGSPEMEKAGNDERKGHVAELTNC
jgi:hypothetical protein